MWAQTTCYRATGHSTAVKKDICIL